MGLRSKVKQYSKNNLTYVGQGCNSGGRFLGAYVDLLNAGYEDVSNMEGGYSGWVDSGLVGHGKPIEELKNFCKFRP
ncbi:hypothetical protein SCA6_018024 [Theobroma cacao]